MTSLSVKTLAVIGLASLFACSRQADVQLLLDNDQTTSTHESELSTRLCRVTDTVYFADTPLADHEAWYGKHLRAMKEPVFCPDRPRERYRFLWLRTFHRPIAVRIEETAKDIRIVAKELDGAGGHAPGKLVRDTSFVVTREQWGEFRRLLREASFWQLPTHWPPETGVDRLDGAQWILEGTVDDKYHVVDRWSPEHDARDAAFRRAALFLLSASTLQPRPTDIY